MESIEKLPHSSFDIQAQQQQRHKAIFLEALTQRGREVAVFSIADGELLICLEKQLTYEVIKAIAERRPTRVIFWDVGFQNNDRLKTNAVQMMKSKRVVNFRTV